jgi:nucleoside-diphosphate-sugar epimerase
MKLVVFGATGGIGSQTVEQALAAGHEVTAVACRPSAITLRHERLEVIQGDVFKPETIRESITRKNAVISALGARNLAPTTVYSEGVANIMQAMQAAHVRRILCISASGLEPGPRWQRWIAKPLLWFILITRRNHLKCTCVRRKWEKEHPMTRIAGVSARETGPLVIAHPFLHAPPVCAAHEV